MSLNTEQQMAVDSDGHTLVVAPPGAGKTKLSVDKIERLLIQNPGSRVGAVTFTRDSAGELSERIRKVVGDKVFETRVDVGTFHGHAIAQLNKAGNKPKLVMGAEQTSLVKRAIVAADVPELKVAEALQMIENTKTSLDLIAESLVAERVFHEYQKLLAKYHYCDTNDLIRMAMVGMRESKVPPLNVDYLIIDEYQDTDQIQFYWALEHAKRGVQITVVGDDDQSIYGFRHALGYGGMMKFKEATGATQVTLKVNYRCKKEILDYASTLIEHNTDRVDKELIAGLGTGGAVFCTPCSDRDDESSKIADHILSMEGRWHEEDEVQMWKVAPKSMVVLARNNILLRELANELAVRQIDYQLAGTRDIWSQPPLSTLTLALKSLSGNKTDGLELTLGDIGWSNELIDHIRHTTNGKFSRLNRVGKIPEDVEPDKVRRESAEELCRIADGWLRLLKDARIPQVINSVGAWISGQPHYKRHERERLEKGISTLANRIQGSLAGRIKLVTKRKDNSTKDDEVVRLMTMHASKGLEFGTVWCMATEEGVCPSISPEGEMSPIDEERRLVYVAWTRAKQNLHVSYVGKPSIFITESKMIDLVKIKKK